MLLSIVKCQMLELLDVEISVQFPVDAHQQIQIETAR